VDRSYLDSVVRVDTYAYMEVRMCVYSSGRLKEGVRAEQIVVTRQITYAGFLVVEEIIADVGSRRPDTTGSGSAVAIIFDVISDASEYAPFATSLYIVYTIKRTSLLLL
jgi:hypothetical protein